MDFLGRRSGVDGDGPGSDRDGPPDRAALYRVGEPFVPGRARWDEGAKYRFGRRGHELMLFRAGPSEDVVRDVARGQARFALVREGCLVVLAYRFARSVPWGTAPFAWHLSPDSDRVVPPPVADPEERALLWISLVDADDGVIRAQRGVTLSPRFTRALHESIGAQADRP